RTVGSERDRDVEEELAVAERREGRRARGSALSEKDVHGVAPAREVVDADPGVRPQRFRKMVREERPGRDRRVEAVDGRRGARVSGRGLLKGPGSVERDVELELGTDERIRRPELRRRIRSDVELGQSDRLAEGEVVGGSIRLVDTDGDVDLPLREL